MNLHNVIEMRIKHYSLMQSSVNGTPKLPERQSWNEQDSSENKNSTNNNPESNGTDVSRGTFRDIKIS